MIHSVRLRLTLAYTAGIALIMVAFSAALYVALQSVFLGNLEAGGNAGNGLEQAITASDLARARNVLVAVNLLGVVVAAILAYLVAGRTLRPVEEALDRQRRFSAHASHELRTSLTVIKGEIDVTLAHERTPAMYRETLHRISVEVDHLAGLTRDLLVLARADAAEGNRRERRRVAEAVDEAMVPFRALAAPRHVTLICDVAETVEAHADWPLLQQVIRNLLDNALTFTPPVATSCCEATGAGTRCSFPLPTPAPTSIPPTFPICSCPSFGGGDSNRTKAWDWAWPSATGWCERMVARLRSTTRRQASASRYSCSRGRRGEHGPRGRGRRAGGRSSGWT